MANIFDGVPWDHTASVGFDADPTITYFFRMNPTTNLNEVFIHDELSNTTTVSDIGIATMFPNLPTDKVIIKGSENQPSNIGEHLIYWMDNALSPPLQFIVTTSPTAVPVYIGSTNPNNIYHSGTSVEQVSSGTQWKCDFGFDYFYAARGTISHLLYTGNYGGVGQPYAGLPYIGGGAQVETEYCSILRVTGNDNQVYLFRPNGDAIILDLLAQQISSTVLYGPINSAPPLPPPTPLPDIVVTYTSPTDYGYFASNVALVTDTEYGFNFTKTGQANADKMELYLYFATAAGAIPFNYDQLRDIKVSMKNNLVLQSGNIFFNVYTVGTAGGWYGTKTTYFGTPPLGTTFDNSLVETIISISDIRTDQIMAISLGSNSAAQQVNVDVNKTSFEILLPLTNETQRVEVQLESSFIVVDDKYWDLVDSGVAKLGTTIKPDFEILDFTPNIIAGNYPQSGTAKGPPQGTAWYLAGTWSEWTQTAANVWAPNGNTIQFTSNAVNPGLDTNGAGWIGTIGGVALTGTWSPQPFTWNVLTGNIFNILHTNGSPINFSPLVNLPQPNNFTAAQAESGMFSSSNVGTMATSVLISNSVSPFKSPIFPVEIDLTFLSETQVIMRRSWEIIDTTYTISSSNVLSGQYISPTYPNDNNTASHLPDSYTKATPWVVLAENNTEFEILFSGGLNNRIPADVSGTYTMTVTPTPANTALTFAWTANYYTAGDVLISAVAGIGTTGLVSSFTVGGASLPASAAYILYGATSSENIDAFTSLVFIEPPVVPYVLTFVTQNSQILTDGQYHVYPKPLNSLLTYSYAATFRDIAGNSLGAVPNVGTSGVQSAFTITYATLPANVAYIDYESDDGTESSQLSITIVPAPTIPAPIPFVLHFNSLNDQIHVDGTYTVKPVVVDSTTVYAYTAEFRDLAGTSLGAVAGAGASGVESQFTITYATLPPTVAYIDYNATATGGAQGGSTSQLSITIVPTPAPPCPPIPEDDDITLTLSTTGNIEYKQFNPTASLKLLTGDRLPELKMTLVDSYGDTLFTDKPVYYECEIRSTITKD